MGATPCRGRGGLSPGKTTGFHRTAVQRRAARLFRVRTSPWRLLTESHPQDAPPASFAPLPARRLMARTVISWSQRIWQLRRTPLRPRAASTCRSASVIVAGSPATNCTRQVVQARCRRRACNWSMPASSINASTRRLPSGTSNVPTPSTVNFGHGGSSSKVRQPRTKINSTQKGHCAGKPASPEVVLSGPASTERVDARSERNDRGGPTLWLGRIRHDDHRLHGNEDRRPDHHRSVRRSGSVQ